MKEEKNKGRGKAKAIISIALAAIVLASVFGAIIGGIGAYSIGGQYNIIEKRTDILQAVLIGQDLEFPTTEGWTLGDVTVSRVTGAGEEWCISADANNHLTVSETETQWTKSGAFYVNYVNSTTWDAKLIISSPSMPLDLKVGTKSVTSIVKGTSLIVDTSGMNLFENDTVKLVIIDPYGSQIKSKDGQVFDPITVKNLTAWYGRYSAGIDTTNFDVGDYTFQIKTKASEACGLTAESAVKDLEIRTGEIAIEADKTSCVELQSVRLTVTGVPGDDINVASSPLSPHVIFRAGVDDTPTDATNQFNHTIDADGIRTYSVKFNDTGTFTIKVTVTSGPRYGEYDTVDITVSGKEVVFDVPSTVVIGEKLDIKGVANAGSFVDVFVDDLLYDRLNDLVIEVDGTFSKEVTTTDVGMTVPGSVMLKAWIDCDKNPGEDPPTPSADGETAILLTAPELTVELSPTVVAVEDDFTISGTAKGSTQVEIIAVPTKGGGGNSLTDYGEKGITLRSSAVSMTDGTFTKNLTVQKDATPGNYDIFVLSPGMDAIWDLTGEADLVAAIYVRYGIDITDPVDIGTRTQEQIHDILVGLTTCAGSDDLIWTGNLNVVSTFDTEPSQNPYPSIMGTHNGTITPSCTINVSKLYTYSCIGTGGHTKSIELFENETLIANGTWNGYTGDWHNITIHNVTDGTPYVTLLKNQEYRYVIKTGSYPQIIHAESKDVTGGVITCTSFEDANGKVHYDWIPAIRLWAE